MIAFFIELGFRTYEKYFNTDIQTADDNKPNSNDASFLSMQNVVDDNSISK